MTLFEQARHEPPGRIAWDPGEVQRALESLVTDTVRARLPGGFWPTHPSDDEAGDRTQKTTYSGAAGVVLALHRLERDFGIDAALDLRALAEEAWSAYLAEPDTGEDVPSLYLGALGILLVRAMLGDVDAESIEPRIAANATNPTLEQLWGAPGSMLVAYRLGFEQLYFDSAKALFDTWQEEADGVFLWEQDLYGSRRRYLGAAHGAAGNLFSLLLGADWLPALERATLFDRAARFLLARSRVEGDVANVRPVATSNKWLVQWCHGAPGIITSFRPFPRNASAAVEQRLLELGELTWRAGPVAKGPSLCHGTAGNGYALLQLFERTGNELWLDRARAFAMHTAAQIERRRAQFGMAHCSLFTGDAGAALFLADCLRARAAFPLIDSFP